MWRQIKQAIRRNHRKAIFRQHWTEPFPDGYHFAIKGLGVSPTVLPSDAHFKKVQSVGSIGLGVKENAGITHEDGMFLVELLIHRPI